MAGLIPDQTDTAMPHPARMCNYYLAGKDIYPVDEAAATHGIQRALEPCPSVLRGAFPEGSYLVLSHLTGDFRSEAAKNATGVYQTATSPHRADERIGNFGMSRGSIQIVGPAAGGLDLGCVRGLDTGGGVRGGLSGDRLPVPACQTKHSSRPTAQRHHNRHGCKSTPETQLSS